MSTSIALSATAVALASDASNRTRVNECRNVVEGYTHESATVVEAKHYADCINTLHPSAITGADIVLLKSLFVIAMVCGFGAAYWEGSNRGGLFDVIIHFFLGFIGGPLLILLVIIMIKGVMWVVGV